MSIEKLLESLAEARGIHFIPAEDAGDVLKEIFADQEEAEDDVVVQTARNITTRKAVECATAALVVSRIEFGKGSGHKSCYESARATSDRWIEIAKLLQAAEELEFARIVPEVPEPDASSPVQRSTGSLLVDLTFRFSETGSHPNSAVYEELKKIFNQLPDETLESDGSDPE